MADPIDHFPAILGLIGTLSGTAIGFAGGFVGQLLLERKKQEAEKKKKKSEKFEELVSLMYEDGYRGVIDFAFADDKDFEKQNALLRARIRSILTVYFPLYIPMYNSVSSINVHDHDSLKAYIERSGALVQELEDYAKREFQLDKIKGSTALPFCYTCIY